MPPRRNQPGLAHEFVARLGEKVVPCVLAERQKERDLQLLKSSHHGDHRSIANILGW